MKCNQHTNHIKPTLLSFTRHRQVHPVLLEGVTRGPPGADGLLVHGKREADLRGPDRRHRRRHHRAGIRRRVLPLPDAAGPVRVQHGAREPVHRHHQRREQCDHFPESAFFVQVRRGGRGNSMTRFPLRLRILVRRRNRLLLAEYIQEGWSRAST